MALTLREYQEEAKRNPPKEPECFLCKSKLDYMDKEGGYRCGNEEICADCHFEAMGQAIDEHPIGRPMSHGGCH